MPADPARVSAVRSIAANRSWAATPNRSERTAAARAASPMSLDYWINKTKADGVVRPQDRLAAAQNAYKAHMRGMALKAAEARQRNSTQRRRPQ